MPSVKRNLFANYAGSFWASLMGILFVPVYIRFIGIEGYGLVGVFFSLMAIFGLLDAGLSGAMNREMARLSLLPKTAGQCRDVSRTLEVIYWCVAVVVGMLIVFLAAPIARYWVNPGHLTREVVEEAIMIMGLVAAFRWPVSFYSGGLLGLQRQVASNFITAGAATFRALGVILVLWLISPTVRAFFLFQLAASALETAMLAVWLWRSLPPAKEKPRFRLDRLKGVSAFATGMTGISIAALIVTQADKVMLSKMLSLEQFGYYTLAWTVTAAMMRLVFPVVIAVYPRLTQAVAINDEKQLTSLYHKACQTVSVMLIPATAVLVLFSDDLLFLWSRDPDVVRYAGPVIKILSLGTCLGGFMQMAFFAQLAHGWTSLGLFQSIVAVFVVIPLLIVLTSHFGAIGAAFVWVILNAGYFVVVINIMHRRILKRVKWDWYIYDVGLPAMAALMVAVPCKIVMPTHLSLVRSALYIGTVGGLTFLAAVFGASLLKPKLLGGVRILVRHLAPRNV